MKLLPIYKTELYIEIEQISNIFLYKDKTLFESVKSSNFRLFSNTFSPITPYCNLSYKNGTNPFLIGAKKTSSKIFIIDKHQLNLFNSFNPHSFITFN